MLDESQREAFDYDHGGTASRADADAIVAYINHTGAVATREDSGDLFRVYIAARSAYFWPEESSDNEWKREAATFSTIQSRFKEGRRVRCPEDRGQPAFTAKIEMVYPTMSEHMGRPFAWVNVRTDDGRPSVWPSHRLQTL